MKLFKYFAAFTFVIMAICITSCGSKSDSDTFEVTVDNTTIGGKLSQYFSLVDKTYKYKKDFIDEVTVELKCINPLPENMEAYIGLDVLDENGMIITVCKPDGYSFCDYNVLQQATSGQTVTVKIKNHENVDEEKPAKIRLSSIVNKKEESESVSYSYSSDDESSNDDESDDEGDYSSSSDSEDWDALLDSYESYVDNYITLAKKAANGDMNALTEYASVLQKAQDLSEKMENAKGEMSSSQLSRYMKITTKLSNAAMNI